MRIRLPVCVHLPADRILISSIMVKVIKPLVDVARPRGSASTRVAVNLEIAWFGAVIGADLLIGMFASDRCDP